MEQLSLKDELRELILELKAYLETRYDIARLGMVETTAIVSTVVLMSLIIMILLFGSVLFLSFGLAFYLGQVFQSNITGFLVVGLAYLVLTIVLFVLRNYIIRKPILRGLIMLILPKEPETDDESELVP